MIPRREFLAGTAATATAAVVAASASAQGNPSVPSNKMVISAFNDALDWCWAYGNWGAAGVERLMERYQQANIQRVYWRANQGSLCWWPTKVGTPYHGVHLRHPPDIVGRKQDWYTEIDEGFDIRAFDQLAAAGKKAPAHGVDLWVYYTPFLDDDTGDGWGVIGNWPTRNGGACFATRSCPTPI